MSRNTHPNILFVITDDHRHSAIQALGNEEVHTPVLDDLSKRGVAFTKTHIMGGMSGAVCMPSRANVLSGANVFRAGGQSDINPELTLMPELFKQNGYDTYAVGKWHNDIESFNKSFTGGSKLFFGGMSDHYAVPTHEYQENGDYLPENATVSDQHSTELFTDAAVEFLHNHNNEGKENPFFLYVAYTAPHDPRTAPQEYHDLYDPEQLEIPPNFLPAHPFDSGEMDVRDEQLADLPRRKEEIQEHLADYYAMITHMDHHIGRIIQELAETGQLENTIIVYTADHGLAVGQHGMMGKQNMYDHSIRIPLILSGPGLPEGREVDGLISHIDIYPTLCSLAGIRSSETVEGMSHLKAIMEEEQPTREYVYSIFRDFQRMIKNDRWKLIRYYKVEKEGTDYIQLFDLEKDPWETRNLAGDEEYKDVLEELADELGRWQKSVGDPLADIPVLLEKD